MIVYVNEDKYSACTAAGLLFYGLRYKDAEDALAAAGFDPAALDDPVDPITWRSTLTAAFASEIESLNAQVAELAPWSDLDQVQERQAALQTQLDDLKRQVRMADIRIEIQRLEQQLDREFANLREAAWKGFDDHQIRLFLRSSPTSIRLNQLAAEYREL